MIDLLFNIVGVIGVALILIAYFLLQVEKMSSRGLWYNIINLIGAIMILISLYRFWNLASFVIEIFWIAISIYGAAKAIKIIRQNG